MKLYIVGVVVYLRRSKSFGEPYEINVLGYRNTEWSVVPTKYPKANLLPA